MDNRNSEPASADDDGPRAYIRLTAELRQDVRSGRHRQGELLPSVTTLSRRYGCPLQICAKSLRLLADEGLIIRYPGMGYYVWGDSG